MTIMTMLCAPIMQRAYIGIVNNKKIAEKSA